MIREPLNGHVIKLQTGRTNKPNKYISTTSSEAQCSNTELNHGRVQTCIATTLGYTVELAGWVGAGVRKAGEASQPARPGESVPVRDPIHCGHWSSLHREHPQCLFSSAPAMRAQPDSSHKAPNRCSPLAIQGVNKNNKRSIGV